MKMMRVGIIFCLASFFSKTFNQSFQCSYGFSLCDIMAWSEWGTCNSSCNGVRLRYKSVCCNMDDDFYACLQHCNITTTEYFVVHSESDECGSSCVSSTTSPFRHPEPTTISKQRTTLTIKTAVSRGIQTTKMKRTTRHKSTETATMTSLMWNQISLIKSTKPIHRSTNPIHKPDMLTRTTNHTVAKQTMFNIQNGFTTFMQLKRSVQSQIAGLTSDRVTKNEVVVSTDEHEIRDHILTTDSRYNPSTIKRTPTTVIKGTLEANKGHGTELRETDVTLSQNSVQTHQASFYNKMTTHSVGFSDAEQTNSQNILPGQTGSTYNIHVSSINNGMSTLQEHGNNGNHVNSCRGNPCDNGVCSPLSYDYICFCDHGFEGKNCDIDINECASNPCMHGDCTDFINMYQCNCNAFYTGKTCSTIMTWPVMVASASALVGIFLCFCCCWCILSTLKNNNDRENQRCPRHTRVKPMEC